MQKNLFLCVLPQSPFHLEQNHVEWGQDGRWNNLMFLGSKNNFRFSGRTDLFRFRCGAWRRRDAAQRSAVGSARRGRLLGGTRGGTPPHPVCLLTWSGMRKTGHMVFRKLECFL